MATFEKGILGGFSGKVGNVVGARWRGRNIMRSLPSRSSVNPSELQVQQREKFKTVIRFLNPIKYLVSQYFGSEQGDKSPFNLATSYYLTDVVVPEGDGYGIDYTKALISKGDLLGMVSGNIAPGGGESIAVVWSDNSGQGNAGADDQLIVIAYAPSLNLFQQYNPAAERADATVSLNFPAYFSGAEVQVWGTFVTADGKLAATSSYLGAITVP